MYYYTKCMPFSDKQFLKSIEEKMVSLVDSMTVLNIISIMKCICKSGSPSEETIKIVEKIIIQKNEDLNSRDIGEISSILLLCEKFGVNQEFVDCYLKVVEKYLKLLKIREVSQVALAISTRNIKADNLVDQLHQLSLNYMNHLTFGEVKDIARSFELFERDLEIPFYVFLNEKRGLPENRSNILVRKVEFMNKNKN